MNQKEIEKDIRELTEEAKASILTTGEVDGHILDKLNRKERELDGVERAKFTGRANLQETRQA